MKDKVFADTWGDAVTVALAEFDCGDKTGHVAVFTEKEQSEKSVHLSPQQARKMAKALNKAAREAERVNL